MCLNLEKTCKLDAVLKTTKNELSLALNMKLNDLER